jgi:hypothetical protein
LCQAVALLGILVALVLLFVPIEASFADDPLLRLQGFGRQAGPAPTTADCGSPLSNLGTPSGGGTLYEVARDRACHEASKRRAAIAFAGGMVLVVLGVAGVVRGQQQGDGERRSGVLRSSLAAPRESGADEGGPVEGGSDAPAPEQQAGDDASGSGLEGDELPDAALPDRAEDAKTASGRGGVPDDE